jgi:hypothetical protein
MKYFNLYRVSSCLLIFFAVTHTIGGLLSKKDYGQEADAVLSSMKAVHFNVMGTGRTYYDFYFGFGITGSVLFLFSAAVAWFIGGMKSGARAAMKPIIWAFFISYVLVAVISWIYFFIAPGITATIIAILLGMACIKGDGRGSEHRLSRPPAAAGT